MSPPTDSTASAMSWAVRRVRALEQQVLEEVARAGQCIGLVARARADPEADRHGTQLGQRLGHDPNARVEARDADALRLGHRSPSSSEQLQLRQERAKRATHGGRSAASGVRLHDVRRVARHHHRRRRSRSRLSSSGPRSPNSLLGRVLPGVLERDGLATVAAGAAPAVTGARLHRTLTGSRAGARSPSEPREPPPGVVVVADERERELARVVDVVDPHGHLVAKVEHVLHAVDALAAGRASRCAAARPCRGARSRTRRTW